MAGCRRSDGQGQDGGDLVGPNPTDRAKNGVKRSLLVEKDGGPLAIVVAGANVPDAKLLARTIEAIVLERPEPEPDYPQHLCLDKAYDNDDGWGACVDPASTRTTSPTSRSSATPVRRDRSGTPLGAGSWSGRWLGCRS